MVVYIHLGRKTEPTHLAAEWPESMVLEQWLKAYLGMEYTDDLINDVTSGVFAISSCSTEIAINTSKYEIPIELYLRTDGEWILKAGRGGIPVHFFADEVLQQADRIRAEGMLRR